MEEDIKIIKKQILEFNQIKEYANEYQIKFYQSVENLIKEYNKVREARNWLSERISAQIATPELFDRILEENYIPKSKIKEKIEELEYYFKTPYRSEIAKKQTWTYEEILCQKIKLLQELMEDK